TKDHGKLKALVDSLPFIYAKNAKLKANALKKFIAKADTNFSALMAALYLDPRVDFAAIEQIDKKFSKYSVNEFYVSLHNKVMTYAPIANGHYAPDVAMNDLNGTPIKISSTQGHYTMLYFW